MEGPNLFVLLTSISGPAPAENLCSYCDVPNTWARCVDVFTAVFRSRWANGLCLVYVITMLAVYVHQVILQLTMLTITLRSINSRKRFRDVIERPETISLRVQSTEVEEANDTSGAPQPVRSTVEGPRSATRTRQCLFC